MSDYNNIISDKEIHDLFKQRLLTQDVDDALTQKLIDMETQLAFSNDLLIMPDLAKEKKMLQKLVSKTNFWPWGKWLFTGLSCAIVTAAFFVYSNYNPVKNLVPTTLELPQKEGSMTPQKPEQQKITEIVSVPVSKNNGTANSPVEPQKFSPIVVDTLFSEEKPVEHKRESTPILNFAGATGIHTSAIRFANDSNKILVDTIFRGIKVVEISGSFCNITVDTHAENQVNFKGELKSEFKGLIFTKPEYKLHYTQKDSVLIVWVENAKKSTAFIGSFNYEGHLDFVMPKQTTLIVKNASGNVAVKGLEGKTCTLGSNYGNVSAENISSKLNVNASSGDINLSQINGDVNCRASYGNVNFKQVNGNVQIISASGNVKGSVLNGNIVVTSNYGEITLSKVVGNVGLSSSSGNIFIDELQANKTNINCSYGDLHISNATSPLTIKSNSGKLHLHKIAGNISAHAGYGNVQAVDIKGDLVINSSSGDINITNLTGAMNIVSSYGNVTATDCISQVSIKSSSGNIKGKNIQLVKDLNMSAAYGDITMNLKNDISELSFNLNSTSGILKLDKGGVKITGHEGKIDLQKGSILVKSVSGSGNQSFN